MTRYRSMLSFEEFVYALEEDEDSDHKGYLARAKDAVVNQALSHPLRTAGIAAGTAAVGIGTGIHISNKGAYYLRIREKIKKNEPLSEEEIEAMKHLLKKKDGKTNSVIQEILDLFKNRYAHRL